MRRKAGESNWNRYVSENYEMGEETDTRVVDL